MAVPSHNFHNSQDRQGPCHTRPHQAESARLAGEPQPRLRPVIEELDTALDPSRPYYLGTGILDRLPPELARLEPDRVYVLCDPLVQAYHGRGVLELLRSHGLAASHVACPRGEAGKTIACLEALCERLLEAGATKDSVLLAVGGGATGNLVGMAAALLYRGVRFVHVPTTLMAQTDSVLSNKQAVNSAAGKNLLGVFHAPAFIWADTQLLATEEPIHLRSALAESFKNAFVSDPGLLKKLDGWCDRALAGDPDALHGLVRLSVLSKIEILKRDPTERRYAMCLEYGHTFGHALETLAAGKLTHGQAVAIGMMLAAQLSHRMGFLDAGAVSLHEHYLRRRLGLEVEIPPGFAPEAILDVMRRDNKRTRNGVRFVLLNRLGEPLRTQGEGGEEYLVPVEDSLVMEILRQGRQGGQSGQGRRMRFPLAS